MSISKDNNFAIYTSPNLILKVDKEGKNCLLKLNYSTDDKVISEDEFLEILERANVVYGFQNVKEHKILPDGFFEIAKSDLPSNFLQAEFLYNIPQIDNPQPEDLSKMRFVAQNQSVGSIRVSNPQQTAMNIFGKPAYVNEKVKLNADDNFILNGDNILSKQSGYLYKDKSGVIRLLTKLVIEKDIYKQEIFAKIELLFKKDILASTVESAKSITVLGSVRDCKTIYSEENIKINSAIDSKIIAKETITFSGKVTDSKLIAGKIIHGKEGSVVNSGNLVSGKHIDISNTYRGKEITLELSIAPVEKEILKLKKLRNVKKILNEIEKEFYNFQNDEKEHYIRINRLKPNIYLRAFNKSVIIKKEQTDFIFS